MANSYSSATVSSAAHLTQGFNFIVRLDGFTYGFQDVSGIEVNRPVEYYAEGGVNDHRILVGMPQGQEFSMTFSRGLILRSNSVVTDAVKAAAARIPINSVRKTVMSGINGIDPQEAIENGPTLGWVEVYDHRGTSHKIDHLVGLYMFLSLGITSWKLNDLNASDGSALLIETFTIVHTGIQRVPVTIKPPLMRALNDETDVSDMPYPENPEVEKVKEVALDDAPTKEVKKTYENQISYKWDEEKEKDASKKSLDALQALLDKMKAECQKAAEDRANWESKRLEGITLTEFVRQNARKKENMWVDSAKKLADFINGAQADAIKNVKENVKKLHLANEKARKMATESAENLALELDKYLCEKKKAQEDYELNKEKIEEAAAMAVAAAENARAAARAAQKVAKELWEKNWAEKMSGPSESKKLREEFEGSRKESEHKGEDAAAKMKELMEEFEKQREEGMQKTEEAAANREDSSQKMKELMEEFEKQREEGMQRTEEAAANREDSSQKMKELMEEFEKQREEGIKKTQEKAATTEKTAEKMQQLKEEFEKSRQAAITKAQKDAQNMADEAQEMASAAENAADEADAIVARAAV